MSSGYIASAGGAFVKALDEQYHLTDEATRALLPQLTALNIEPARRQNVTDAFADLANLRAPVRELRLSRDYVVDRYTQLISALFDLQLASFGDSGEGSLMRKQIAFIALVQAKEHSGQERALISAMLADGNFSAGRIALWQSIMAVESARLASFIQLADSESLADIQAIQTAPYVPQIARIRQQVQASALRSAHKEKSQTSALPPAERWFALASARIDAMKGLEERLSQKLLDGTHAHEALAWRGLGITGGLALFSFVLCLLLVLQMRRSRAAVDWHLSLSQTFIENSHEAILTTDAEAHIIDVNPAFERISGYQRGEALGQSPRLLRSGRHDATFYQQMWSALSMTGYWQGEIWNRRKNGEIFPALLSIAAVRDKDGQITNYAGMLFDLSQHQRVADLIDELRTFDGLTGLPNREAWLSAINQTVANAQRNGTCFAVLEFDIDRFKLINDSLGHAVGDQILIETAERIKATLRRHDVVARAGSDRFSILLVELRAPQDVGSICEKLMGTFSRPHDVPGSSIHLTASIGAAIYPSDGSDAKTLIMAAESALDSAKAEGRAMYKFYSRDMNELGQQLFRIERMLRQALSQNEFSLVYQPQFAANDGRLVGVEALLRWQNPELGNISPAQFIPIAEDTGLIVPIGEWVMRSACEQGAFWYRELGVEIPVAVNLSARQFRSRDLMASIQIILDETGLPPRLLELEITEGLLIADPVGTADLIQGLNFAGIKTALDDFGTGYSSLAYLKTFHLNRLKIDRSFVRDLPDSHSDRAIANTVITLGHQLSMEVLAEGVETQAQADFLRESGCHTFQGYLFARPMPGETISELLRSGSYRLSA